MPHVWFCQVLHNKNYIHYTYITYREYKESQSSDKAHKKTFIYNEIFNIQ